jgi:hypothetical protein
MTASDAIPTTEIAILDPQFSDAGRYALGAFLAGYRGRTRDAYALDLRQFVSTESPIWATTSGARCATPAAVASLTWAAWHASTVVLSPGNRRSTHSIVFASR